MAKSTTFANDVLKLIFNGTASRKASLSRRAPPVAAGRAEVCPLMQALAGG